MLTQEKIAVAAIVLAAAAYLARVTAAKYRARRPEGACKGCGCGKVPAITKRNGSPPGGTVNGSGKPAGISRSPR